jgi:hypothetical protein
MNKHYNQTLMSNHAVQTCNCHCSAVTLVHVCGHFHVQKPLIATTAAAITNHWSRLKS